MVSNMNYMVIRGKDEGMEVIHDCMNGDVLSPSAIANVYIVLNLSSHWSEDLVVSKLNDI